MKPGGALYPVLLDLQGRRCLVVGGGRVAARKIDGLLAAGAQVTVVAPSVVDSIESAATKGAVCVERRPYRHGDVDGRALVITATGVREIDRQVASDASNSGIWVNSADDPDNCSFILPAVHRDGPVTIAVSTGGTSPALASWLRDRIGAGDVGVLSSAAELLEQGRRRVKDAGRSTESIDWRALLDGAFFDRLRAGDLDGARSLIDEAVR